MDLFSDFTISLKQRPVSATTSFNECMLLKYGIVSGVFDCFLLVCPSKKSLPSIFVIIDSTYKML